MGTDSVGGSASEVVEVFGTLAARSLDRTSLNGLGGIGGLDGRAGLALGSSWYCIGGIESSPSQPEVLLLARLSELFPLPICLLLESDLSSLSASFRLCFSASSRSTRSRHCNSSCLRESKRAFSVSERGV